ncbi:hypothetical protein HAX54_007280, partial [Datura stramonium]|nr:hypothetical protein [Datura stramonium]
NALRNRLLERFLRTKARTGKLKGKNPEIVVVPEEGTEEETSSELVPETQNDNPQEL